MGIEMDSGETLTCKGHKWSRKCTDEKGLKIILEITKLSLYIQKNHLNLCVMNFRLWGQSVCITN